MTPAGRRRVRRAGLLLVLAAGSMGGGVLGGCGGPGGALPEETYVQVMAKLTWARERYGDTPAGDSVRAATLEEFGVSGQQIRAFNDVHGDDPRTMRRLWERIQEEVDALDGSSPDWEEGLPDDAFGEPRDDG